MAQARGSPVSLFSLHRLLSVRTDGVESPGSASSQQTVDNEPRRMTFGSMMASISGLTGFVTSTATPTDYSGIAAQLSIVAQGGYQGNAYFAVYTTNNYLIFRHVGESGVPVVRMMAWFKDSSMKLVGMTFNHSAQWLICVTSDLTIVILSIYSMLVRDDVSQPPKVIQTIRYTREKAHFSDVQSWRCGSGSEYAVITTQPGNVRLVNLANGECFKTKAKTGLGKFHIVTEPGSAPRTWLIIESPGHGFYRLLIGHYLVSGKYEDITAPAASQKPEFQFQSLTIPKQAKISVQQTQRGPLIIAYDPEIRRLHIHDSHIRLIFDYAINTQNDVRHVHVTERLVFVLTAPTADHFIPPNKLFVFSKFMLGSGDSQPFQEFSLPGNESVRGHFFPSFPFTAHPSASFHDSLAPTNGGSGSQRLPPPSSPKHSGKILRNRPKSVRSMLEVSPQSLLLAVANAGGGSSSHLQQKEMFTYARVKLAAGNSASSGSAAASSSAENAESSELPLYVGDRGDPDYDEEYADMTLVAGAFFWTDDALYELKPTAPPEEWFFRFVEKADKKNYQALFKTFALDANRLFELAGDEFFKRGQHGMAQALYHQGQISIPKIMRQWLSIGRVDEPISNLKRLLGSVPEALRPRVANELIRCYIQRLLNPSKQANLKRLLNLNERCRDEELENFLKNNPDFTDSQIRKVFDLYGLVRFDLLVAQSRRHLKPSLESLSISRGLSYLSMEQLRFISENNAFEAGAFKVSDANTLLSHFPPHTQLLYYLMAVSNIHNSLPRIQDLLHELDAESLAQVCRFFDPQGPFVGPMLSSQDHQRNMSNSSSSPTLSTSNSSNNSNTTTNRSRDESSVGANGVPPNRKSASFMETKLFVSQCVEVFLTALLRLNQGRTNLPTSWNPPPELDSANANLPDVITDSIQRGSIHDLTSSNDPHKTIQQLPSVIDHPHTSSSSVLHHHQSSSSIHSPSTLTLSRSSTPLRGSQNRGLKPRKAVAVACGHRHTALLTENGQLFTWGAGSKGQLGHPNVSDSLWVPKEVAGLSAPVIQDKVIKVACGGHHTMVLTQSGQLFTFGSNARGQLGLGDRDDRFEPRQVIMDEDVRNAMGGIIDIAAGFWHSVMVTERGVWHAGSNSSGPMGALQTEDSDLLHFAALSHVPSEPFIRVRCGFGHTALLTKRGRVYTFGSNENGQLGLGHQLGADTPQLVRGILDDKHIVDISCGSFTTYAVSDVYSIYAWGLGSKGRLGGLAPYERRGNSSPVPRPTSPEAGGLGDSGRSNSGLDSEEYMELSPSRIDALQGQEIAHVVAGPSHALGLSTTGKTYVWGDCHTPMKVKSADPRLPTGLSPWSDASCVDFGCGDDFTVCIMNNGLVYTFGRGICGQLGHNDEQDNFVARQAFLNSSLMLDSSSATSSPASSDHTITAPPPTLSLSSESLSKSGSSSPSNFPLLHQDGPTSPLASSARNLGRDDSSTSSSISSKLPGLPAIEDHDDSPSLSASTVIRAPSSIDTYTSPQILEQSLQQLTRKYRPAVILHQCRLTENLAAASIILEQCGAWAASIDCKIRLLKREFPKIASVTHQTHLLTELLKDLAQNGVPHTARHQGLKQVLALWKHVGGATDNLELMLTGSPLMPAIATLLEEAPRGVDAFFGLKFSSKFLLQVVKTGLAEQKGNASSKTQDPTRGALPAGQKSLPAAKDPMWLERRSNLESDIKLRTKIQISQPALEDYLQHSGSAQSSHGTSGDVAFTCGHIISEQRFTQSTLPLFRDKMAKFPVQLPLTVKLLLADWNRPTFSAACPPCVYNHLRDKHAPTLERWHPQ